MTTEEIEDEIARTRGEMADTLNAIERRLSPQQIVDQAVDTMRDFLSDRTRVAEMVRDNPIPLALVGLGLGWLAVSAATSSRGASRSARAAGGSYESMEGVSPGWAGDEGGAGYAPGVESPSYGTAGSAEYVAGGGTSGGTTTEAMRQAAERAAERAKGRVSQWSQQARVSANQAADRTRDAFQDHPLTVGALAMAMGAAVGALLPRSRTEAETLGEMGGELARQARQTGSELAEKAGRVAERAMQSAKEEGERAFRQETGSPSGMTH
ncbi:MAG: DUF3618 domain-containing protein [Bacteroidales bacterium]